MHGLIDFYEGIGNEMARIQIEDELRELQEPPHPSLLTRLINRLRRSSIPTQLFVSNPDELPFDTAQCE